MSQSRLETDGVEFVQRGQYVRRFEAFAPEHTQRFVNEDAAKNYMRRHRDDALADGEDVRCTGDWS